MEIEPGSTDESAIYISIVDGDVRVPSLQRCTINGGSTWDAQPETAVQPGSVHPRQFRMGSCSELSYKRPGAPGSPCPSQTMALYLALLTHLCVHVLGLMGNPVLTLIFSGLALIVYWLYLLLLPALWPGQILHDMLTCFEAMQKYLHEEAAHRRTLEMYDLSTYGLSGLEELKRIREVLFDDHCFHLAAPLPYAHMGLSLCKRTWRCKRNVEVLCRELDLTIQRFDNPDTLGDDEAASRGRAWFDAVLTALIH
ncbi:hypothetical protein C8R44DRAFT_896239 [Mycena epipterygia]|nr:hypothetical protein C8R44DRAFT_896239 [Mycena epipterygia]